MTFKYTFQEGLVGLWCKLCVVTSLMDVRNQCTCAQIHMEESNTHEFMWCFMSTFLMSATRTQDCQHRQQHVIDITSASNLLIACVSSKRRHTPCHNYDCLPPYTQRPPQGGRWPRATTKASPAPNSGWYPGQSICGAITGGCSACVLAQYLLIESSHQPCKSSTAPAGNTLLSQLSYDTDRFTNRNCRPPPPTQGGVHTNCPNPTRVKRKEHVTTPK